MLIALLVVLGVDLIIVVALASVVVARRRWVKHQPGDFRGAIRVADGTLTAWARSGHVAHGRWVRDVLVWTKAPLMFRNELVPIDRLADERKAEPGEVKRLGDTPFVVELSTNGATVQIAAREEHRALVVGPLGPPS